MSPSDATGITRDELARIQRGFNAALEVLKHANAMTENEDLIDMILMASSFFVDTSTTIQIVTTRLNAEHSTED